MTNDSTVTTIGPAFPTNARHMAGMTLRDYFAAKAMQALITTPTGDHIDMLGPRAYQLADAMLQAREK